MIKVAKLFEEEKEEAVERAVKEVRLQIQEEFKEKFKENRKKTIINMINEGIEEDVIIRICPEFSLEEIRELINKTKY